MKHNRSELFDRHEAMNSELTEGDKVIVTATQEQLDLLGIIGNFSRSRGIIAQKGKYTCCVNFPGRQQCVIIPNNHLQKSTE